ncbi:MAG TPA: S8 family serine peptidase [Chloroflexota bacterium]|nr:S8 family serine peptidase [Chloroflexota bacterium]
MKLRGVLALAGVLLAVAVAGSADEAGSPKVRAAETGAETRPGEVLVELRQPDRAQAVAARTGAALSGAAGPRVHRLRVPAGQEQSRAAALRGDPEVVAAAPNFVRRAQVVPDDPLRGAQWALARIGMPSAWDVTRGDESVAIAILDSGADLEHPDLAPKLLPGANTLGADPDAPSGCPPTSDARDDYRLGHGTHVAGIAAAATDNGIGVAGVAWRPKVIPVKVLDCNGQGSDAQVIAGIDWAIAAGARVINLSVGGPGQSDVLDAAVERAFRAGVLVVAAAGNSATDVPYYPAASPFAFAVGATDASDRLATFSNRGDYIAVVAPGVSILSTYPRELTDWNIQPGYQFKFGTSMASPHVAGLAALVLALHPTYGPGRVGGIIRATAEKVYTCPPGVAECPYGSDGRNQWYGYGRINAAAAVRMAEVLTFSLVPRRAPIGP